MIWKEMSWLYSSAGYISRLQCSFKSIYEKNHDTFPGGAFLSKVADEIFIKVPLFQQTIPALKNFWL